MTVTPFPKETTLRDYMEWVDIFPYSKEYFEVKKEMGEIELLNMFMGSSEFMIENMEFLESGNYQDSLSCTMRGAHVTLESASSSFFDKIGKVLQWILKVITAPFRAIGKLLRSLFSSDSSKPPVSEKELVKLQVDGELNTETIKQAVQDWKASQGKVTEIVEELDKNLKPTTSTTPATPTPEPDPTANLTPQIKAQIQQFRNQPDKDTFIQLVQTINKQKAEVHNIPVPLLVGNVEEIARRVMDYLGNLRSTIDSLGKGHTTEDLNRDRDFDIKGGILPLIQQASETKSMSLEELKGKADEFDRVTTTLNTRLNSLIKSVQDIAKSFSDQVGPATGAQAGPNQNMSSNLQGAANRATAISNKLIEFSKELNRSSLEAIRILREKSSAMANNQFALEQFIRRVANLPGINMTQDEFDKNMSDPNMVATFDGQEPLFRPKTT